VPTHKGDTAQLTPTALAWASGANSGWAGGELLPDDGSSQGLLLRYAP
jgi:hypothetical protein